MLGKITLMGGNEFSPECETMDRYILANGGVGTREMLVIPTASVTNPSKAARNGVNYFSKLGVKASPVFVLDKRDANDEQLCDRIFQASHIYFTGGDPNYLLTILQDSYLLLSVLKWVAMGGTVVGSSAGAMVMGSSMNPTGTDEWIQGLNVVPCTGILPHHEGSNRNIVAKTLNQNLPRHVKILGIEARTGCFGVPGEWKVIGIGRVTVYHRGSWHTFDPGEILPTVF